ncbi:MAG: hypothetical protein ABI346_04790 [Candidatus Baltobacteraceae bacterium]
MLVRFSVFYVVLAIAIGLVSAPARAQSMPVTAAATLTDPNTHAYVGTFVEDCRAKVLAFTYLAQPYLIEGKQALGIDPEGTSTLDISIAAAGNGVAVSAFGGHAQDGCLATGSKLVLVFNPGTLNDGLLRVLGQGIVTAIP